MKNKLFKCLLLIIVTFIYTTANAETIQGVIRVPITKSSNYICYNGSYKYQYHKYSFTFKDDTTEYPAFCIKPGGSLFIQNNNGINNVECEVMTSADFPRVYALIQEGARMWNTTSDADRDYYDYLLRFASIADKYEEYNAIYNSSSNSNMMSFLNSYRKDVLGMNIGNTTKYYRDCGTVGGPTPYTNAINRLKEVEELIKNNVPTSDTQIGGITIATGDKTSMTAKIFTLKLVEETELTATYEVTSNVQVNNIKITTSSNISFEWVTPWDKTSGKLKITKTSPTVCSGTLTLEGDNSVDNAAVYYCKHTYSSEFQNFVVIGPGVTADKFKLEFDCTGCSSDGCQATRHYKDFDEKEIHNCCDEGITKVRQAALDELFCDYNYDGVKVDYYKPRCNAEEYVTNTPNEYCKVYCGTTVMYKIPGPTRALADREFVFSTKVTGFAGPLLNQYNRCRVVINFDQWYQDYKTNVDALVSFYNDNQNNLAQAKMWEDMINDAKTETLNNSVTCTSTFSYSCPTETDPTRTCTSSVTKTKAVEVTTINVYPTDEYGNKDAYSYPTLKVVEDGSYNKLEIKYAGNLKPGTGIKYYDDDQATAYEAKFKSAIDSAKSEAEASGGTAQTLTGTSCTSPLELVHINASNQMNMYKNNAKQALIKYNNQVDNITKLKDSLDTCGGKTIQSGQKDASNIEELVKFKGEPEMEFSYTSKFIDDYGNPADQELVVPFEKFDGDSEGHCASEFKTSFSGDTKSKSSEDWNENWDSVGWFPDRYDNSKYKTGTLTIYDVEKIDASSNKIDTSSTAVHRSSSYQPYKADKKFTTDGVNHMTCKWKDKEDNTEYVVIPYGYIDYEQSLPNADRSTCDPNTSDCTRFTVTDEQGILHYGYNHHIHKTSAAGKFETYYTLKNVADGIIDDVIHDEGKTCSGYSDIINYNGTPVNATCYFEIQREDSEILDCNRKEVYSIKDVAAVTCDGDGKKMYLDYKEVDATQLFPNDVTYGWNWKNSQEGPAVLKKIQDDAKADKTYSPDNLTYSFTLTPNDLRAIKEYNKSRISLGGYTDFNMYCETVNNVAVKCKSRFIDAISGKSPIEYNGKKLELKTNNTNIDNVRSRDW